MPRMGFTYGIKTLSPASEVVKRGLYAATTLSAVDPDLAVGNIKDAVVIFGKTGTFAGGALVEDTLGSAVATDVCNSSGGYYTSASLGAGLDGDLATCTPTFAAGSLAVGMGFAAIEAGGADIFKLRLYMGGVQVAESVYLGPGGSDPVIIIATRALTDAQIVKVAVHNYKGTSQVWKQGIRSQGSPMPSGVAAGSIKT